MSTLDPLDIEKLEGEHIEIEVKEQQQCKHMLEYITSTQVQCKTCHVGFYVSLYDRLKDGHLYHGDELVL